MAIWRYVQRIPMQGGLHLKVRCTSNCHFFRLWLIWYRNLRESYNFIIVTTGSIVHPPRFFVQTHFLQHPHA